MNIDRSSERYLSYSTTLVPQITVQFHTKQLSLNIPSSRRNPFLGSEQFLRQYRTERQRVRSVFVVPIQTRQNNRDYPT